MCNTVIPRPEYPRPQMVRPSWQNLNGQWDFFFDFGNSGVERKFFLNENFDKNPIRPITVPFCPESRLSGIGYTDFIPAVWYRRTVTLEKAQLGGRVLIHFGAVDYAMKLWVNEQPAGAHVGGYSSFTFDITAHLKEGENTITVWAEDNNRSGHQPRGKQSVLYHSHDYIKYYRVYPNIEDATLRVEVKAQAPAGTKLTLSASFDGEPVGEAQAAVCSGCATAIIPLSQLQLWAVGSPNLYDLELTLGDDKVTGYFGMRSVEIKPDALYLNGKPFFMRTILDQGFNPEGIYTAPSDDFLRRDLELSMEAGFNGARLHQRVFEERTLYWADKLGYIVWGEYANNNVQYDGRGIGDFLPEWMEVLERDFNHPALIGWCINNESYWMKDVDDINQRTIYDVTKRLDPIHQIGRGKIIKVVGDIGDAGLQGSVFPHRLAVDEDRAAVGLADARKTPQKGGLAGAVGAHQAIDCAPGHVKGQVLQGLGPFISLGKILNTDHLGSPFCRRAMSSSWVTPVNRSSSAARSSCCQSRSIRRVSNDRFSAAKVPLPGRVTR